MYISETRSNLSNKFQDILDGKKVDTPLVGTATTSAILELMDISGASRPEADRDPEKMVKLASSFHTVARFEVIRIPFDVTVVGEALGCQVDIGTKARTPSIITHPFDKDPSEFNVPADLLERGRIPVVMEAISILKNDQGLEAPLVAGVEGPADLASYLCGIKSFLKLTVKKPEIAREIVEKCVDACIVCANTYLHSGADAVVVADSLSSPEMIGPDAFRNIVKPALIRFNEKINDHSILHICGEVDSIIPDMLECGFNAISVEENVKDLEYIINSAHRNNTAVIGNVSTADTLYRKAPEDVRKEAFKCLDANIDILAPGCGLAPETPLRNLLAMVEARDKYAVKKF
ncbi:methylcobamide:CoM methyltransferase MtaA [Methanolobus bombayensis]|uniref:methylcobamide:CoM methyltransferase MtaA n=1 Tax=Methanolobus bombayensis TaxID=38023 RepID=UPI001AE1E764|nr:methylcobamide:CoM methyltransferase MtaA [Methanolobus bombayensis]MBP1908960.1 [methyl-Co(III) methanol-specific corrinoid protein]:coenzyme M methyltransferase [Methanolobus bombayensis]